MMNWFSGMKIEYKSCSNCIKRTKFKDNTKNNLLFILISLPLLSTFKNICKKNTCKNTCKYSYNYESLKSISKEIIR